MAFTSEGEGLPEHIQELIDAQGWFGEASAAHLGLEPPLAFWNLLRPSKAFPFDVKENVIPLFIDRSIAVTKDNAICAYINNDRIPFNEQKVFLTMKDAGKDFKDHMLLCVNTMDNICFSKYSVMKHSRKEDELKIWVSGSGRQLILTVLECGKSKRTHKPICLWTTRTKA